MTARVVRRELTAQLVGGALAMMELVRDIHDPRRFRAFFAAGTDAQRFTSTVGCAEVTELRDISGALMLTGLQSGPDLHLGLNTGPVTLTPRLPETDLLAGRNVLMGMRLDEPAETVAEWLLYHHAHHGATAALVVNRAPPGQERTLFADRLEQVLLASGAEVTCLVVEPDFPLGKPDMGPENHPFLAPDAPGKDRMTPPKPDPWRAPLGEAALFELLKWRWLATARAVAYLEVCDILAPRDPGVPDVFDRALAARSGVVLLVGRRIYPWRVRPGQRPTFGDHICRQFDARRGIARWAVAPDRSGLDNTWRAVRISFSKPELDNTIPFWRAMGIRIPDRPTAELAPKTSLIEDQVLLDFAQSLGAKPVRAPASAVRPLNPGGTRTCIVTTMKNEAPFILEWLAWHRAIGVDDFLIYTNDCTDGTDTMLMMLQEKGLVQHRANPWVPGGALKPQHAALQAAESEPLIQRSDWAICMDVDEFINVKLGDGRLPTLYKAMEAALPGANMISLTWRLFGNAHVSEFKDDFMLAQFDRCAPEVMRKPHQAWGFKTLFRNVDLYKKLGVHRPKGLKPDLWSQVRWLNGSGRRMPDEMLRNGWRSTMETYGYDWVQLNHYAVRSAESFLVKRDRGRVNHVDRDQGLHYWFRMNHNVVQDRSIQTRIPMLQAEWDRLMADPEIRAAHQAAVTAHRSKIDELRATEKYTEFYNELNGERLRLLSERTPHFGSAVFNAGPGVIPDEIALMPSMPPNYYFSIDGVTEQAH